MLEKFSRQINLLKEQAGMSELLPVWLMASALEGLLEQLSLNASDVTSSVLKTIAGAVDFLEALCVRDLDPTLATKTPIQLLAVDDDPVCRQAISLALKKAFKAPDLATHGEAALALAADQNYDVIFLDVEMPGMDGFELCSKIHETALNRTTPVVFVTRHSDFNFRAKSTLLGGEDLIAKPYLSCEITLKALTLALRCRLENHRAEPVLDVNGSLSVPTQCEGDRQNEWADEFSRL
jgi:PleD family two-component response regulator